MVSTNKTTDSKIVVLDYNKRKINTNYYLLNNLNIKPTILYQLNINYTDIIKIFKENLVSKMIDGRYIMNYNDSINLDKMIGLACIAMNESEENNKRLRMRNKILEITCENNHSVFKECIRLKSKLDNIIINLCLALGRKVNLKENINHLTNICAALYARENEYRYIQIENDNLKYTLNKQLINIRVNALNNYDEILNKIDKFKEELIIKDLKISQLKMDINSIKVKNTKYKDGVQLVQCSEFSNESLDKNFNSSLDDSQSYNELYEGKMLIVEEINQLEESNNINAENYRLSELIDMFIRSIFDKEKQVERINEDFIRSIEDRNQQLIKEIMDQKQQLIKETNDQKEWQNHLENENEKLNIEIEKLNNFHQILMTKDNEYIDIKKDFSNMQNMYEDLCKEGAHLKIMLNEYQNKLTEKEIKCVDNDHLIKTLKTNLKEEANKSKQTYSMYIYEKDKCLKIESEMQQMIEEFTVQLHRKNDDIIVIQDECNSLKYCISSAKAEIENLKDNIITLEYALNEKNETIQNMLKKSNKEQNSSISLLQFNDLSHILSQLEQNMELLLEEWCTSKKKIVDYEKVLNGMQNAMQKQILKRNYLLKNHKKNVKDIKCQTLMDNCIFKDKEVNLLAHQQEIECLKNGYYLKISQLTGMFIFILFV